MANTIKVILNVNKGSVFAKKNGHTFFATLTEKGFEIKGVNQNYPENTAFFTHKEAFIINLEFLCNFYRGLTYYEFLQNYCKTNKFTI